MNYRKIYERLIEKYGTWEKPFGVYTERHRKIPGHFGGRYVKGNAFYVPARVHYLCHLLLAKIYGGRMWKPITLMGHKLGKTNSNFYKLAREEHSRWMKDNAPAKNPEIAKRHSEWMKGDNNPSKRPEMRALRSKQFKGIPKTEAHRKAISDAYKNPVLREIQLKNLRSGGAEKQAKGGRAAGKTLYQCTECFMVTTVGALGNHQKATGHRGKSVCGTR